MMKRTIVLSLIMLIGLSPAVFAQQMNADPEIDTYLTKRGITEALPGTDYTGSAYLTNEFSRGAIYKDGRVVDAKGLLRYNALRDEIEIKSDANASDAQARILFKNKALYVKILNDLYVFEDNPGIENAKPGYFEVLLEGAPYSLYCKHRKVYIEGKKSINSISADILPNFKDQKILYLVDQNGVFTQLPDSRNGKLKQFGEDRKQLKRHIADKNLHINKDRDLVKLVNYYNKLKTE